MQIKFFGNIIISQGGRSAQKGLGTGGDEIFVGKRDVTR
jgi:hypothetical protein